MAHYQTTLFIPVAQAESFAYVSDFSHATWDPRVSSAQRVGRAGPIGVGSQFVLVSPLPVGRIDFPYEITRYDPPHQVTLRGQTWFARYQDDLTLMPAPGGCSLSYDARFDLRGLLWLGSPLMQLLFQRIGKDATRGIPAAVARGAAAAVG